MYIPSKTKALTPKKVKSINNLYDVNTFQNKGSHTIMENKERGIEDVNTYQNKGFHTTNLSTHILDGDVNTFQNKGFHTCTRKWVCT